MAGKFEPADQLDETTWSKAILKTQLNPRSKTGITQTTSTLPGAIQTTGLTTYTLSDILQGVATYKPKIVTLESFNTQLSQELQSLRTQDKYVENQKLSPYDVFLNKPDSSQTLDASTVAATTNQNNNTNTNAGTGTAETTSTTLDTTAGPGTTIYDPPAGKSWPKGTLSFDQLADLVYTVQDKYGAADKENVIIMVAIAPEESGRRSDAHGVGPKDDSWGLWQINILPAASPQYAIYDLTDPWTNATIMNKMSGNGSNRKPWSAYNNGRYLKNMEAARAAVDKIMP